VSPSTRQGKRKQRPDNHGGHVVSEVEQRKEAVGHPEINEEDGKKANGQRKDVAKPEKMLSNAPAHHCVKHLNSCPKHCRPRGFSLVTIRFKLTILGNSYTAELIPCGRNHAEKVNGHHWSCQRETGSHITYQWRSQQMLNCSFRVHLIIQVSRLGRVNCCALSLATLSHFSFC
jgi:hypothetical protein